MAFALCQSSLRVARASCARPSHQRTPCPVAGPARRSLIAVAFGSSAAETAARTVDELSVGAAADQLDPCLGWDMAACEVSKHMALGKADEAKLAALERAALDRARMAVEAAQKERQQARGAAPEKASEW